MLVCSVLSKCLFLPTGIVNSINEYKLKFGSLLFVREWAAELPCSEFPDNIFDWYVCVRCGALCVCSSSKREGKLRRELLLILRINTTYTLVIFTTSSMFHCPRFQNSLPLSVAHTIPHPCGLWHRTQHVHCLCQYLSVGKTTSLHCDPCTCKNM